MCTVYITITMIINHGAKQEFWWISQTLFLAPFRNKPKHSPIQFQMWYFAFILLYTHSNLDIYHKCVPKIQFLCQFTFERLNESEIGFLFQYIYPFISSSFICFVTDILFRYFKIFNPPIAENVVAFVHFFEIYTIHHLF